MTDERIVEAMARLDGYTKRPNGTYITCSFAVVVPPDYLNDHNAVQRAIDGLNSAELIEYRDCLYRLFMDDDYVRGVGSYSVGCLRATPRQKCEAILKAKGVWE